MDPVLNPFRPGAGAPPPELAGRDELLGQARVTLERTLKGTPSKSLMMVGLRGVGKTVLLERMSRDARAIGFELVRIEAPEGRSLPALLAPELRRALIAMSRAERSRESAERALRALRGFARALKVKYGDIELSMEGDIEPGVADNGDLEHDLQDLMLAIGQVAAKAGRGLGLFVDEIQYVPEDQLAALIVALHRCAQDQLPIVLVGAGLPQLRGKMGRAKSYAERLFSFPEIGRLDPVAARAALARPAEQLGASFTESALDRILTDTDGYPYFLQEWGKNSWDVADSSPIDESDVDAAAAIATAELDASFFGVRFDRATPTEKRYLRAMAELGPGPHRSSDIAEALAKQPNQVAPTRNALIAKGLIYSPGWGETAFTVPMFDGYMLRIMPLDWRDDR